MVGQQILPAVTLGNTDGEIGGLTISEPPTQAEVQVRPLQSCTRYKTVM